MYFCGYVLVCVRACVRACVRVCVCVCFGIGGRCDIFNVGVGVTVLVAVWALFFKATMKRRWKIGI